MALTLDDVYEASYKKEKFIMDASSIEGGRKTVQHEFVNSNKQVVEDLGLKRRSYSITAIISGVDYENRKKNFLAVLEDGKKGLFIHPFEGGIPDMIVKTFSLVEDFRDFGVATFRFVLSPSDDISEPEKSTTTVVEVQSQLSVLENVILDTMNDEYLTTPSLTGSIENSINKATSFIDRFTESTRGTFGTISTINSLNSQILDFTNSVSALVQTPADLSSSIGSLFSTANAAYDSNLEMLNNMIELFDFGSEDNEQLEISTAANNEINQNNDVLNYSVNSFALGNAYFQLVSTDLRTIEEIESYEEQLEAQFDLVTNDENLNNDVRVELTNLRTIASEAISEVKTTTPELVSIEVVNTIALRKLEYLYYEENTRTEEIISINSIDNPSFVDGDLEILNDIV
ncbi:MAG: DNA circularization N-terminal domain-containing protein [Actinomycetia bacterium]|nr:DNA circularization N-terminal domain-containing protein [Actinomycetes bacterium]